MLYVALLCLKVPIDILLQSVVINKSLVKKKMIIIEEIEITCSLQQQLSIVFFYVKAADRLCHSKPVIVLIDSNFLLGVSPLYICYINEAIKMLFFSNRNVLFVIKLVKMYMGWVFLCCKHKHTHTHTCWVRS